MSFRDELFDRARSAPRRILLPEMDDRRIEEAARQLADLGLGRPVPVYSGSAAPDRLDFYAGRIAARRERMTTGQARRLLSRPLFLAAAMLEAGDGDMLLAGATHPTRRVIEAGMMSVGLTGDIATPSSFFLMLAPEGSRREGQRFIFSDCAVNIAPDSEQLADIAIASAATAERLLGEPARVALLSFSTHGSAAHGEVDRVTKALAIIRERMPELSVDGELQADAALSPGIAERKIRKPSAVAGRANVLIFPDLASGNIAYKLLQELGQMQAIGPFLQGFARPICDLSRGATVDDIVLAALLSSTGV
ncbi:MAG: phosphate acetyltransferase [Geminicoccaceae bacterium]|nr:phosphate acetyltransferase [Geminicoccaceae bacterium]